MLVSPKAIDVRWEDVGHGGQAVEVFAVDALWTYAAREKEAEVGAGCTIGFCVAAVFRNVTASLRGCLAQVFVLTVAAAPFVVPDVEDGSCGRWGFGFEGRGIDLRSRGAAFAADDLLDFLAFCICRDDGLFSGYGSELGRCGGFERCIWRRERRLRRW